MATGFGIAVRNWRELNAAFALADKATQAGLRDAQRDVAEPVRSDAEALARDTIPRIGSKWPQMRVAVTRRLVYVAPKSRGTRGRTPQSRPNLGTLLMTRAMEPALQRHEADLEARVEAMLDRVADGFN